MKLVNERLEYLYRQYTEAQATEAEVEELFALVDREEHRSVFQMLLSDTWDELQSVNEKLDGKVKVRVIPLYKRLIFRVAAAAMVILLAGSAIWFLNNKKEVPAIVSKPVLPSDIRPGSDKAILTLADGRQVILDNTTGTVANEKGIKVINLSGQLLYKDSLIDRQAVVSYHTVATPRGGQYQLVLEDGTKVWLNAASSLRFPTSFPGKDRVVELTGEAYFEVAHNASKPFHVKKGAVDVSVLGTHFNINAYDDEEVMKVTLLEGSVKVSASTNKQLNNSTILQPGQQAQLQTTNYKLQTINDPDLDNVMAWKKGIFLLDNTDLPTLMRQISRWYDVDVEYETKATNTKFVGGVSKKLPLSKVLKLLEGNGLRFQLEGKTLKIK